ncbi:MAG: MFS transporter [Minisyncoccia bacterium]|jgi:MFS family permease
MTSSSSRVTTTLLSSFWAFWLFLAFYKFAATLHYSLLSPLGARLLPLWIIGLLIGGESLFQMFLDMPAGYLIDRFGRRRMLAVGWVAFVGAAFLLTQFSLVNYILSITLSVIGWLFFAPGVNAYVLSHAQKETSGRFIALRDIFYSIGVVLASISLPFVLLFAPFIMGIILLALLFLAIIVLWASPPDKPVIHGEHILPAEPYHIRRISFFKTFKTLKKLNPASGMLCAYTLAGSIFYGAIWFVVPLVIASNPHQQLLGLGLGIFDLTVVLLGVLIGTIVDRGNKRLLVFYGLLIFALMGMLIGITIGPLFLLFGFLATSGDETTGLSLWSWLHSLDKEHAHDGAIAGVISFSEDLGYAIGPIVAGSLFAIGGPGWAIAACTLPIFIALIIYVVYARPKTLFPSSLIGIPQMPRRRRHKS